MEHQMRAKQEVYAHLDRMGIEYEAHDHPAVYTIEETMTQGLDKLGPIAKNLFLRDSKGLRHFLVMMRRDKKVDLKKLQAGLGSTSLRFASEERLKKYLGLEKGAVGPFGILNDEEKAVEVIVDQDLKGCPSLGVHPNDNTATVWLAVSDLERIFAERGNPVFHLAI
ncbi:prolyl-tRNA synthetase associated domain-containing protein [Deltaproteobacteria bacterium Smac51]|nr:prolyl-tRNA synthetase associated domain-containing protein [Deltaproteobacteria bacterium Smac51]